MGQYWDDVNNVCGDYFCEPALNASGLNDPCVLIADVDTPGSLPCDSDATPDTSGQCQCLYGYYPDNNGTCTAIASGSCDPRPGGATTTCTCSTTLNQCQCNLGYYPDDQISSSYDCISY